MQRALMLSRDNNNALFGALFFLFFLGANMNALHDAHVRAFFRNMIAHKFGGNALLYRMMQRV